MKELHDERLDIPVLSVCSVVCDVQMIEVIRKESMVAALDPMRLDFILTLGLCKTLAKPWHWYTSAPRPTFEHQLCLKLIFRI